MIEALYCHIPFCETICPFCAFAVHGNRPGLHAPFLAALRAEAALVARRHGSALAPLRALYIGGGTPSTLALAELNVLLAALREGFPLAADCEVAFELNPEHASEAYLAGLVERGITRASLGLQSLDGATLRALGRNHSAAQGRAALAALQRAGPPNWNVDLMFAAPGRPAAAFLADVRALVALRPPHLSLYGLDIEPGTRFARSAEVCEWAAAHRDEQAESYVEAARLLGAAGYRHYEVSNFCLPGREGRQNELVWDGAAYLGLGPGAHSFADGRRWHNERHLRAYLRRVTAGEAPIAFSETLTRAQQANEALMLDLRRDTGLDVQAWSARFGFPWDAPREALAARLVAAGHADRRGGRLVLRPTGLLLADEITAALAVA